ncbi:L-lactate permease [Heliobacterium gestii]|uniref:L-lactate permease n=1 Tax=Heliomicrobium gestii TaxID=2699 RepID=A0A845LFD3_HELGE|nr:L-lactate permease [Heliomicrobium gestii]MBM7867869.1 lactate permease [Heliomicrobium gestii]MZP43319.1 L-lactate permease [Heliomicrobium gestii]
MTLSIIPTLLPILVIVLMIVWKRIPVHISGMVGWVLTILVSLLFLNTSFEACLRSSLSGFVLSLPVSLIMLTSILQMSYMEQTGALRRIVVFLKTLAPGNKPVQIMLLNIGAGTAMVSIGATPTSILPPLLVALGYSPFVSVAMATLGFDALCTYALIATPLVVYSDLSGASLIQAAQIFALYLPPISTLLGFGMLWLVGGWSLMKEGFIPCIITGLTTSGIAIAISYIPFFAPAIVLTGIISGLGTIVVMLLYLKLIGQPIHDRSLLTPEDLKVERQLSLPAAMSPWLILTFFLVVTNFYPPIFDLLFNQWSMPIEAIPGKPIKTRALWNAYTWALISTVAAMIWLRPSREILRKTRERWLHRAIKPAISAFVFYAIAYVMNNSGLQNVDGVWKIVDPETNNMISILAGASAAAFGVLYPSVSAFLGLFGGFVSSSQGSGIAMFTKYNLLTSEALKVDGLIVNAAASICSGLANAIAPAKVQGSAATIDALGIEYAVIRKSSIIIVGITAVISTMALVYAYL